MAFQDVIAFLPDKHKLRLPLLDAITLIDDATARYGAVNMALDEVLLGGLADMPVLRCYRWVEREISFGCFGPVAGAENEYPGVRMVRRWTGGGMVEHGADFTFTLLVPKSLPLAQMTADDSYQLIHEALAVALLNTGIDGLESADKDSHEKPIPPEQAPFLKPCFTHPVEHDLLAAGEKIAGGAQRRTRAGLLHQGSVQNLAGRPAFTEPLRANLASHLAATLAAVVTARVFSGQELAAAEELATRKYAALAWTRKF